MIKGELWLYIRSPSTGLRQGTLSSRHHHHHHHHHRRRRRRRRRRPGGHRRCGPPGHYWVRGSCENLAQWRRARSSLFVLVDEDWYSEGVLYGDIIVLP